MNFKRALLLIQAGCLLLLGAGCGGYVSYPQDKIKEAILEICEKEYDIKNVDVKISETTIGVYLPLKKLFAADFKEALVAGKIRDLESLLEPAPEALEKIEDVLFTISRVLLSTDKPLDFYTLVASDVEKTGMQLILNGYINDVKRVRVWDISRDEYRKRIVHEIRANRAAKWHQPVRRFFTDLESFSLQEVQASYFGQNLAIDSIAGLFFNLLSDGQKTPAIKTHWKVLDMRSVPVQKNQALVYCKVKPEIVEGKAPENLPDFFEYLFLLNLSQDKVQIARIIPFQYQDKTTGGFKKVPFPKELQIEHNLDQWDEEFVVQPIHLGDFLAEQIGRRIQAMIATDERMTNTFREIKLDLHYQPSEKKPVFFLPITATLTQMNNYSEKSMLFHEDMIYFLNLFIPEFTKVLRSYRFEDYQALNLKVTTEPFTWTVSRENLELLRVGKIKIADVLSSQQG